jgi:hypothetical protein
MRWSYLYIFLHVLLGAIQYSLASYPQAFTVNSLVLPDGTLLFHDLFISSDRTIILVSAPGFGIFKNSDFLKSLKATALYASLGSTQNDMKLDLTLNVILDESTPDGEVKVVSELTHPNLEMVILICII